VKAGLDGVERVTYDKALKASTTHRYDFLNTYVSDLANIIDFDVIRNSRLGDRRRSARRRRSALLAGIAERYRLNLKVLNTEVDPTFAL